MTVIDTHVWLWWADEPARLSDAARQVLTRTDVIGVSVFSCWELGMLVRKGRLRLDSPVLDWIADSLGLDRMMLLDLTPTIAVRAASFDRQVLADPADRIIAATALQHGAKLVTKDDRLRKSGALETIW